MIKNKHVPRPHITLIDAVRYDPLPVYQLLIGVLAAALSTVLIMQDAYFGLLLTLPLVFVGFGVGSINAKHTYRYTLHLLRHGILTQGHILSATCPLPYAEQDHDNPYTVYVRVMFKDTQDRKRFIMVYDPKAGGYFTGAPVDLLYLEDRPSHGLYVYLPNMIKKLQ